MEPTVHDQQYEKVIFQTLPAEYEKVRLNSYEKRDFGLDDIRHTIHAMYVDNLLCCSNSKPISGCRIVIQATGHTTARSCSATYNESASCATHSWDATVCGAREHYPSCDADRPYTSFTTVEVLARAGPIEEEGFWSFGPMDKPAGLFGGFGGERAGGSAFMIEEGPIGRLRLWRPITVSWRL